MWRSTLPTNAHSGITAEDNRALQPGTLPTTASIRPRQSVFDAGLARKITSNKFYVGFYEHSGDSMYTAHLPSSVGGGVMAVLPGVMGVSAFAPPLDEAGNSVKAQLAVKFIMNELGLGVLTNGDNVTIRIISRTLFSKVARESDYRTLRGILFNNDELRVADGNSP